MTRNAQNDGVAEWAEPGEFRLRSQVRRLRNGRAEPIGGVQHYRLPVPSVQHLLERIEIRLGLEIDHDR